MPEKVKDTIQKKNRKGGFAGYFSNIRVYKEVLHLYGGKEMHRVSLKTKDPKDAERKIRALRTIMDAQMAKARSEAEWKRLAEVLPSDQRKLLEDAGGVDELAKKFEAGKVALQFMKAATPQEESFDVEGGDVDYLRGEGCVFQRSNPVRKVPLDEETAESIHLDRIGHAAVLEAMRVSANADGKF
ncbi:hypothetical protein [Pseudohalocynthiibacter sp. F2068]|jgi:hypothetical protein|uniref:hypothetical protein n=1 Tax=Pseudohalocynthiibacter sp. F2068 TaxID=2926418 RepID=UPI001FF5AEA2|nr:hypothetical protein [Pseudohalocynthiibacter sp. F2068]MCK0101828.1 hypothetical protein [Pseudohalocynthiibacter sp. F2068]